MVEATKSIRSLLTTGLVARAWGVSESLVRYCVRTGRLIPIDTTPTGAKLFDRIQVERVGRERQARQA
jgi:hypothetical protein